MVLLTSRVLGWLPLSWALALARFVGWLWYYAIPIRRSVARANVRRALGRELSEAEQKRVVRDCFCNFAMYTVEVLRAPMMTLDLSKELVERQGVDNIEKAWAKGKGVLYLLTHIGNVDMIGFSQPLRGLPLHGIVKKLHSRSAEEFVSKVRERTGLKTIPPRRSKDQIKEVLARNEMVGMVVDQHVAQHRAIVCEFFGQLAATSPALARFAFETGAPILPAVIFRRGKHGHHLLRIEPEFILEEPHKDLQANIRHNTERLNRIIERWIREEPGQWLWLHKRWKVHDDPAGWDIPAHLREL